MPFNLGRKGFPFQEAPEQEEDPLKKLDFLNDLFVPSPTIQLGRPAPSDNPLRDTVTAAADALAVTIGPNITPKEDIGGRIAGGGRRAPVVEPLPVNNRENFGLAMREGMEIALIGAGTVVESIAQMFNSGNTAESLEASSAQQLMERAEEWGAELRRQSGADLIELAQVEPNGWFQYATRVSG